MRYRTQLHSGPPAEAQRYKTLAWLKESYETPSGGQRFTVKLWRGKALKPLAYYLYVNDESADAFIEQSKRDEDSRIERAASRKIERATRTQEKAREIVVGTILHYSWGYEQTNSEYFEVIERNGLMVVIREIAQRTVPGSDSPHGMADSTCPAPGEYIGPPIKKRITDCGLSMEFGVASVVHPWESHYRSWYA